MPDDIAQRLRNLGEDRTPTEREWQHFAHRAHRTVRLRRIVAGGIAGVLVLVGLVGGSQLVADGDRGPSSPPAGDPSPAPNPSSTVSPSPRETATVTPSPPPVSAEETTAVELWYGISTDTPIGEGLFVTYRDIPTTTAIGEATLRAWIEGPTTEEESAGIHTSVPEGTELLGLDIEDGTAVVDLSAEFEQTQMGAIYEGMLLEQLAWTITQFPTVDRALLTIEGEQKEAYMGHGLIVDEQNPMKRGSRASLAPILMYEPRVGDQFASGDTAGGTSDVFEGNLRIRIRDSAGEAIFEGSTTATCGTGCRGEYSERIRFNVDREQPGSIEIFEESAEDGAEINKVTIPVTLMP